MGINCQYTGLPMSWYFLAIIAPLMYAVSNILDKYVLEKYTSGVADYMAFASIGSMLLWLFFYSIDDSDTLSLRITWPPIMSGALLNISYLFFALSLIKSESYKIAPYFLLTPILLLLN